MCRDPNLSLDEPERNYFSFKNKARIEMFEGEEI